MSSKALTEELDRLKESRKQGEISPQEFYAGLLKILGKLTDELKEENISDDDIKKQIPLILVFLEEQISKYAERGH